MIPARPRLFGMLLAALALLAQVTGAVAMPEMQAASSALGVICSAGHEAPAADKGSTAPRHRHMDCAVCPLCAAACVHAAILTPAAWVPLPRTLPAVFAAGLPQARAPPARAYRPGRPRGPPAFA